MMKKKSSVSVEAALKTFRLRATAVTFLIFDILLLCVTLILLSLAENRLQKVSWRQLNSSLESIQAHLSSQTVITNTWLSQQERFNEALIFISDGGTLFHFEGAWIPPTPRTALLARAEEQAAAQGVYINTPPTVFSQNMRAFFQVQGDAGDRYYGAATVIRSQDSWQSLVLLCSDRFNQSQICDLRLLSATLIIIGSIILLVVCWWLSGQAAKPIAENMRKQTEFVAAASHELKAPLAVISASASVLGSEPQRDAVLCSTIQQECMRMGRLVGDLLTLARSDGESWSVEKSPVDMDSLLFELWDTFLPITMQKHQKFFLDLPECQLPYVIGDSQRLKQLLTILLDNAHTYTQENGEITLAARKTQKKLLLYVKDNGPGIPPKERLRVFERFYRSDPSRESKNHSGLGLPIAKELARLHKGRLYIDDEAGYSTVFCLELPIEN